MELLKVTLCFFTFHILSHAQKNPCSPQYCGTNPLPIRFPFTLQPQQQQPQTCGGGGPGFALTCSSHDPVLTLPYSGNFSVRYINYLMQEIQLYDPDGCLPRRLMTLNLSSSPFAAMFTRDFIFLSCPRDAEGLPAVECLGNSTTAVVATTSVSLARTMSGYCRSMFTLSIPVSWDDGGGGGGGDWLSSGLGGDLRLTWSSPDCQGCEARGGVCGYHRNTTGGEIACYFDLGKGHRGLEVFKIIALSIVIPAIICSMCISCFTCIVERRAARNRAATAAAPLSPSLPPPTMVGLDESTIESYKKVVLGESKRLPGPNGVTCPICLVDYCPKDTLRCIPECQHCFHSECIDEWLRLNSSCPVCRNSPSHPLEAV